MEKEKRQKEALWACRTVESERERKRATESEREKSAGEKERPTVFRVGVWGVVQERRDIRNIKRCTRK